MSRRPTASAGYGPGSVPELGNRRGRYVGGGSKTHSGVLPQPRTLEPLAADKTRGRVRNGRADAPATNMAEGSGSGTPVRSRHRAP